jgi:nucleoside 2-deoxyribosyltransferase
MSETLRVYCAGPLFNDAERAEMRQIADILEKDGHDVFLPQRDGIEYFTLFPFLKDRMPILEARLHLHRIIFQLDVHKVLGWSDAVVANLNGTIPDPGTCIEAALAWHTGKRVVFFKNDARTQFDGLDNAMIRGLGDFSFVDTIRKIPSALTTTKPQQPELALAQGAVLATKIDGSSSLEEYRSTILKHLDLEHLI